MAGQLFTNNAKGKLNAGILAGDLSLVLQAGQGALFPVLGVGDYCYCTLVNVSTNAKEYIKVTARTVDTMTIVRAQDGSIAQAFSAGDLVELRLIRQALLDLFTAVSGVITSGSLTMATARLLGRTTGGSGAIEELSVGSGLTLSAGVLNTAVLGAGGQCVLVKVGADLVLSPRNGNVLIVNGVPCTIPDAGVTLAPTALSATTLYYIYATATAGVVTALEASTTGHSPSTAAGNKGVEIMTGDETKSLVGMAYVKTAATFADSETQRFVRSWFNDWGVAGKNALGSNVAIGSGPLVEISAAVRAEGVFWAGENISVSAQGGCLDPSGLPTYYVAVGVSGVAMTPQGLATAGAIAYWTHVAATSVFTPPADAYKYIQLLGGIGGGAAPYYAATYSGMSFQSSGR